MMRLYPSRTVANVLAAALLTMPVFAQDPHQGHHAPASDKKELVPLYDNLGSLHYEIGSSVPLAQRYFDQGLRLTYGFNHAEAVASFQRAVELDPSCAMCHWGVAWASGPNINAAMDSAGAARAVTAVASARRYATNVPAVHRALIHAMSVRYAGDPLARRKQLDSAYMNAMRDVAEKHPDDAQARVLYAESIMLLSPWNYWSGKQPRTGTDVMLAHLTTVMKRLPDHPGACHFFIHAVEAAYPERAVECAERLARLMPGAGHIVHMPGHIYIRVGRYMDAIRANEHAVHADESWIRDRQPGVGSYTAVYYPHNYDFLAFAASMAGRSTQAIEAAERAAALVPMELLGAPGPAFLQSFLTRSLQVRVRFSKWDEILAYAAPARELPYARGIWHYARGRAFVARGDQQNADKELAELTSALNDPRLKDVPVEFNLAVDILGIARDVLDGRIAHIKGDWTRAVTLLRTAAGKEDALVYGEPPEWSIPVRHDLGEVLLAQDLAKDAATVYREDLERFPRNGWSLNGLARSLEKQGLDDAARAVRADLRSAWRDADVKLRQGRR
jgi:tetratricopeptide (TPR) repeat protein